MFDLYTALAEWRAAETQREVTCPRCGRAVRISDNQLWMVMRENAFFMESWEDERRRNRCISCGWKPDSALQNGLSAT